MIDQKKIIAKYFSKEEMDLYMVHLTNYIDLILDDTKTMQGYVIKWKPAEKGFTNVLRECT